MTLGSIAVSLGGFDLGVGVLSLGVFTGLTYGLLAAGLVLVYRSSRFINFAHGAIGVFGAAVCSLAVRDFELPYWVAFLLGLIVAAGVGATTEIAIVKPLASRPKVLSMAATLGMSSFLIFTALAINPNGLSGLNFPQPTGMPGHARLCSAGHPVPAASRGRRAVPVAITHRSRDPGSGLERGCCGHRRRSDTFDVGVGVGHRRGDRRVLGHLDHSHPRRGHPRNTRT
jgi:branched-subunit amino acid ABC-type transport system permease component